MVTDTKKLDNELTGRDLSAYFAHNKILLVMGIALIFASVFGYGLYSNFSEKNHQTLANRVYAFSASTFKDFKSKKIEGAKYVTLYKESFLNEKNVQAVSPIFLKSIDEMSVQKLYPLLIEFTEGEISKFKSSDLNYLVSLRLASAYEEVGKIDQALRVYESLQNSSLKVAEPQIYLNIGRLYLQQGNFEKATVNLQYIIDTFKTNEDMKKLARLFLGRVNLKSK